MIGLIPKKVYAVLVAALLVMVVGMGFWAAGLRLDVARGEQKYAQLETQVARDAQEREWVAREDALEVKRMQAKHASLQQETVHAFHKKAAADRTREHGLRTELDRLRDTVRDYAAGGREADRDPDTCRSDRDRSRRLGELVQEALDIQGESESFIRQRDREVRLLKDLLSNDRALMTPVQKDPQ